MKRGILLAILSFLLFMTYASTRQAMLKEGKTWNYRMVYVELVDGKNVWHYPDLKEWIEGDTIINGQTYFKMHANTDGGGHISLLTFWREEDGRVYQHNIYNGNDELMYDFNLSKGEKVEYDNHFEVISTDSIMVHDILRKRIVLPYGARFWVEGIGNPGKLSEPLGHPVSDGTIYELVSCFEGDTCVFDENDFYASTYKPVITLNEEEKELVNANNDFALRLFQLAKGDGNMILSPLSVTFALGMLNNGSNGLTQQEINQVLGSSASSVEAINQFCYKLLTESRKLDLNTKVNIANNIYVNKGYTLKPEFIDQVTHYYEVTPECRDFHDGETVDAINRWASDQTSGMIDRVIDKAYFDPDAVSYLLNAIYFNGLWTNQFNEAYTTNEPFNGVTDVPMMEQFAEFNYTQNNTFEAIKMPYGNLAYEMIVVMPREDKTIDEALSLYQKTDWNHYSWDICDVHLKFPRFKTSSNIDLNDLLIAMGMPSAFDMATADFSDFCDVPISISKIMQSAIIKVNEKGSEAAAVTVIEAPSGGAPVDFFANRPFFYVIRETSTKAIFFIGQFTGHDSVTNPVDDPHAINTTLDSPVYNIAGQRMTTPPAKGIYIHNGRKYVR